MMIILLSSESIISSPNYDDDDMFVHWNQSSELAQARESCQCNAMVMMMTMMMKYLFIRINDKYDDMLVHRNQSPAQ